MKPGHRTKVRKYALAGTEDETRRLQLTAERAAEAERSLWTIAGVVKGASVADIGCGTGRITVKLAEAVGPSGRVWGIDRDRGFLDSARAYAAKQGAHNIVWQQADAANTGLDRSALDVAMLRHVLAHNGGQESEIVGHLSTLVHPGGCVYLVDVELTAMRVRPSVPELEELNDRYVEFHTRHHNDISVALRLRELLVAAELEVVEFTGRYDIFDDRAFRVPAWAAWDAMVSDGLVDANDLERFSEAFEAANREDTPPVYYVPFFVGIGRRPR